MVDKLLYEANIIGGICTEDFRGIAALEEVEPTFFFRGLTYLFRN